MSDSDSGEEVMRRQRKPAFAMLDDSDEDEDEIVQQPARGKKNAMALLADSDDDEDDDDIVPSGRKPNLALLDDSDDEEEEEEDIPQPMKGKKGKKDKKKGKKAPPPPMDSDEEEEEEEKTAQPEPEQKGKKGKGKKGKGKKGKGKKQEAEEEDIDALLDAVVAENKAIKAEIEEDGAADQEEQADKEGKEEEGGGKKKKKRRNKKKKGDAEPEEEEAPAPEPEPTKSKKGKPKGAASAIAKKAREQAEKLAAERERQAREEEERRRQEAEEKRRREEELRLKEEEAEKRREENRLKKEKLKKEGRYMTKAQAKKAAIARAQLEKMGAVPSGSAPQKKHRPLPGKKKKGPSTPKSGGSDSPLPNDNEVEEASTPAPAPAPAAAQAEEKKEEPAPVKPEEPANAEEPEGSEEELGLEIDIDLDDLEGDAAAETLVKTIKSNANDGPEEEEKEEAIDITRLPLEERIELSREKRRERMKLANENRSPDRLRSPICVVLGHVDTGKTKILDKIRRTNVQEGEAGGITQQIGATYFPMDRLRKQIDKVESKVELEYKVPGLLVIDTPGHESFTNLRSRGTNLCDIAVLVVDLMHGLEPQTIESLNLLMDRKTPFVVALNKIDRCYGWKSKEYRSVKDAMKEQEQFVIDEFERRAGHIIAQFSEQGLNAELYFRNKDKRHVVSLVPTSAMTGEGIPDLLYLITQLTQRMMAKRLMYKDIPEATVLEVKSIEGLGTTIDVVLVNGELKEGDSIVVCGMKGPIVTKIRGLLTPHPAKEIRVKGQYLHHKSITAAMGVKIAAQYLEDAIAGTSMYVVHEDDEIEDLKEEVMEDFEQIMSGFQRESRGVYVQASTLGSLEALLEYLRTHDPPVPVCNVAIGPVHKRDVMAASAMLEHREEYATILAFDVKITPEAQQFAQEMGVTIFSANIIYHLTDMFEAFLKKRREDAQRQFANEAVFPCMLQIRKDCIFNKRDPIVVGVDVLHGSVRIGTPLCVILAKGGGAGEGGGTHVVELGRVTSLKLEDNPVEVARAGGPAVSIAISPTAESGSVLYGRQFDHNNKLYSRISRRSIDVLKETFADELSKEEWGLVVHLKKALNIQ